MDWYEPEHIWEIYGIKTRDQFVKRFVVEGKFHENVPEDISKSFITVSYLLAHSYYHWPMFDEALSKALLIMEMSVKLKAKELNISIERTRNNKRPSNRSLVELIDEICDIPEYTFLKQDFNRARNLRNIKMHPDRHSFSGVMSFADANAILFINVVNMLFLDSAQLKTIHEKVEQLENELTPFKSGLHVLEFEGKKILIDGFHMFKYRELENNALLLLYINPLTTKVEEQFLEHKYPDPLIVGFSEYEIKNNKLKGIDINGETMSIYISDKPENLDAYGNYCQALSKIPEEKIHMFSSSNSSSALWKMERMIYEMI